VDTQVSPTKTQIINLTIHFYGIEWSRYDCHSTKYFKMFDVALKTSGLPMLVKYQFPWISWMYHTTKLTIQRIHFCICPYILIHWLSQPIHKFTYRQKYIFFFKS